MSTDDTDVPSEFDLATPPAEGDGYYQAKTRQWVDLCPHMGFSEKILLHVLTGLTTRASNRRKLSLDELLSIVPSTPVALGEEPKFLSPSGLLRILRNLAALGQITADEDGTPIKFSSRDNARSRQVSMTVWRLPRHDCGCHRNFFDALDAVRGEEPAFEPARVDESAVRRRTKRAGQKSNPRRGAGQHANPLSQGDQQEPAPPITPPSTLSSSSSGGTETSPLSSSSGEKEEDAPPVRKTPSVAETVMARVGATSEEALAVIEAVEDHAERNSIEIGSIGRYIAGFDDADLRRHLRKIRAQNAPELRTEESQLVSPDVRCETHHEALPCGGCKGSARPVLVNLLKRYGPGRRPDLKELVSSR
ncbi:hypothetical protein [Nocardiopsis valliformis]|uniref:hypothetical protein n=1 Tax=Nocardiopsis valliformis TaxID=239974 RepID=UPI00034A778C|nr:hypothetical protein [Nocardiopsis valliformis]